MASNKFTAGIITVPERGESCEIVRSELVAKDIPYHIFVDFQHQGFQYNFCRRLDYFALRDNKGANIIWVDDDIIFKEGWLEKANELIEKTDYEFLCFYTNSSAKKTDEFGVFHATSRLWLYDPCIIIRAGIINETFAREFYEFASKPERTQQERNHYDNMMSAFTISKGYKCGIVRPNMVSLQNVKSTLGHNCVIK